MDFTELYKWTNAHSKIFSSFIEKMNEASMQYFVLRNYEGLPEKNNSKDIDIIIKPKEYMLAKQILLDVFRQEGLTNYYIMNFERAHCVFGINIHENFAIHIDLIEGYANKGFEFLSFEYLYSNTVKYKNFRVLETSLDAVMLILYKVIGCKELKDKYRQLIHIAYKKNAQQMRTILTGILGSDMGDKITDSIEAGNYDNIVNSSKQITFIARIKTISHKPFRTFMGILLFLIEKFHRIIICPSYMQKTIVVEAPDGTGKTTFINQLLLEIAHIFVSDISKSKVLHFRPSILPNLGAAGEKAGIMTQDKNFTVPHRAKPANSVSSFMRMTYYWLDYVIGMPLILRKNAQFDKITIFDRYIYDFLVDPLRTRIKLPYWIRLAFVKMVKQPKVVFVLDAPADVIYSRKQELRKDEIERQLVEFRRLRNFGDRVYVLDATQSPEAMAQEAIKILVERFTCKL